ncbi:ccr4 associated factor [Physocladia obscura]|uniref:Ccr4 associated factor n=1 Tax=Physocladia obscura TaxID=109957 RepID=A0AAD5SYN2_9FUNG|nr:ccr4 associated factor [Physocladia obscura]
MLGVGQGGAGVLAGLLGPHGRVLFDAFIHPLKEREFLLDVDARQVDGVAAHLRKYALRAKVRIADATPAYAVQQAWGPAAAALWRPFVDARDQARLPPGAALPRLRRLAVGCSDPRHPALGVRFVEPKDQPTALPPSFSQVSDLEFKILRILNGIPEGMDDFFPNASLPLESNLDLMSGIDFRKGCYLGQELTIRTYHTGVTRKRIVPVQIYRDEDSVPTELTLDTAFNETLPPSTTEIRVLNESDGSLSRREVGKFCSGVNNIGLALMRLDHVSSPEKPESSSNLVFSPKDGPRTNGLKIRAFLPSWFPSALTEE